jgi:hypothetical protein|mmetsp:Transcript_49770/g.111891  ORF Transcript_49770/g.111891 Transcript_49770/m.111891 type:complete len:395 (-) Transcript_49770:547-1731(-)
MGALEGLRPIGPSERPVLFVTYASSELHELRESDTYRKLQGILSDLSQKQWKARARYRLVLLYQRNKVREPFNCTVHVPIGAHCAEYTREDMKREFGHTLALHRRGDAPRRLNVGFWVCALWLLDQHRAGASFPYVWFIEDDVYLPQPWPRFFRKYDREYSSVDLLTAQVPYFMKEMVQGSSSASDLAVGERSTRDNLLRVTSFGVRSDDLGWARHKLDGPAIEFDIARGRPRPPTQLSVPEPTLTDRLPVKDDALFAKVPLYAWRLRGRLVRELVAALGRGAVAHEEIFVPTTCQVSLRAPGCSWGAFEAKDVGIPCGTSPQDAWYNAHDPEFHDRLEAMSMNRTQFQAYLSRLQMPKGVKLLPSEPQRMYHPVKGQLTKPQTVLTLREAGGV